MTTALLLSGGLDSVALCYWKRPDLAVTVDYGQVPAEAEAQASAAVCAELDIEHQIIKANCAVLGTGDLAGTTQTEVAPASDWWPFRNQLIVTIAAARAVTLGVTALWIGTVSTDKHHADGSVRFVEALDCLLSMQEGAVRLRAPAIDLSTPELVRLSRIPIALLAYSHSCHVSNSACGRCRGCCKHRESMQELGFERY